MVLHATKLMLKIQQWRRCTMFPSNQALPTSVVGKASTFYCEVCGCACVVQEHFFTPYKEVVVNGQKKKITPYGHIDERLKTVRKFEGVRARLPRAMKRVAPVEMDATG
jgi:hypothetical protein